MSSSPDPLVQPQGPLADPDCGADAPAPLPTRIVFFDGVCSFCDHSVQWLLAHDPRGLFHYAPLQGETAAALRQSHGGRFPDGLDTLVYLDRSGPETAVLTRSEAVFAICHELEGPVRLLAWGRVVPRPLADLAYRAFAAVRYRVFGRVDRCHVPEPSQRARFLA